MNLKKELIENLSENIGVESNKILDQNVKKRIIDELNITTEIESLLNKKDEKEIEHVFGLDQIENQSAPTGRHSRILVEPFKYSQNRFSLSSLSPIAKILLLISVIGVVLIGSTLFFVVKIDTSVPGFPYSEDIPYSEGIPDSFFVPLIIILVVIAAVVFLIRHLVKYLYKRLLQKFESITPKSKFNENIGTDEVYNIISNTYEELSDFRTERERQARNSYNAALTLIVIGTIIIFGGVYLLFNKSITEGVLTSGIGAIIEIIGGTILKFYRDTNDRMDSLNSDLFTLNATKVQYAMILKIGDESKRDKALRDLITSIGGIKQAS